ncbi:MAG: hypothetical protein Q7R41_07310 [Phycisphaerales bacterium]|nr:hypothetical protein [Phycisphaerales bacterium]
MSVVRTESCKIEHIHDGQRPLACIVHADHRPDATEFVTPDDWTQQVGFIVYKAGDRIARHTHLPIERRIVGTGEVLVVRKGRCEVDLYNEAGTLVAKRELRTGDVLILVSGGHGFRMLEDTVLLEVKQGPYTGLAEKEYF